MAFFRPRDPPPGLLTYEDVVRAVERGVKPLHETVSSIIPKVDDLMADRVVHDDIEHVEQKMAEGFERIESQYLRIDVADQRYERLTADINAIRKDAENAQANAASAGLATWTKVSIVVGALLGLLSFLISFFTNVLTHLAYH